MSDPSKWCCAEAREVAVLVDGAAYYRTLYQALIGATRSIVIAAWQFDPHIELIPDAPPGTLEYPVSLWELLNELCVRRPELEVRVLAWDYSLVYALERTWLAMAQARLSAHRRLHFRWRAHADPRGSHHQKVVVVDGSVAFLGGLDLGKDRWDTRAHDPESPVRTAGSERALRPFHDVQVAVQGPSVKKLAELFDEAWQASDGHRRPLLDDERASLEPDDSCFDLTALASDDVILLGPSEVDIVRTLPPGETDEGVHETRVSYARMIQDAERLIYIETQYFTSSAISRVLIERMSKREAPPLQIVLVMPNGADSVKEELVLGACQRQVLSSLFESAREFGHEIRLVHSQVETASKERLTTYIHSKLMIVDDNRFIVGSANLTNRSMGLDTELGLSLSAVQDPRLAERLAFLRASLLAEHAGGVALEPFLPIDGLVRTIDAHCDDPASRLMLGSVGPPDRADPLVLALFDPATVFDHQRWDRVWEETLGLDEPGLLKRSWEAVKQVFSPKSADVADASELPTGTHQPEVQK